VRRRIFFVLTSSRALRIRSIRSELVSRGVASSTIFKTAVSGMCGPKRSDRWVLAGVPGKTYAGKARSKFTRHLVITMDHGQGPAGGYRRLISSAGFRGREEQLRRAQAWKTRLQPFLATAPDIVEHGQLAPNFFKPRKVGGAARRVNTVTLPFKSQDR
jgi:hypothetical protein